MRGVLVRGWMPFAMPWPAARRGLTGAPQACRPQKVLCLRPMIRRAVALCRAQFRTNTKQEILALEIVLSLSKYNTAFRQGSPVVGSTLGPHGEEYYLRK